MSPFTQTADIGAAEPAGPATPRKPLGELLVGAGFIDGGQLDAAVHEGSQTGERIGEVVVRRGWASEDDVARVLAEQWELPYVDRASIWFDADALARLSREDAQLLEALPIRVEGDRVMVAVAEPTEQRLEKLRRMIGEKTSVVVVPKSALDAGIRSELLRSRGHATEDVAAAEQPPRDDHHPPGDLAPAEEEPMPEEQRTEEPVAEVAVDDTPAVEERAPADAARAAPRPALREVRADEPPTQPITFTLPRIAAATVSASAPDVAALAAQARHVADWIAGQTGAIREYERRIAELEAQLAESQAATQEAKTQLGAVLQLLDVLRPTV